MGTNTAAAGEWDLLIGAPVYDAAAEKLGTVRFADAYALLVAREFSFGTDYEIPLAEVDRYEEGRLILKRTKTECHVDAD